MASEKIQPYQIKGSDETKQVFTATQAGTEQFTLTTASVLNAGYPSGYEVQVYVGGIRQEYNATPGVRQFRMVNSTTVEVGGLVIGDTVAVVHGVD